jgi:hypothetical protein
VLGKFLRCKKKKKKKKKKKRFAAKSNCATILEKLWLPESILELAKEP